MGPSGCGKSTFARRHFLATEIVSSDLCRGVVSDDENDQSSTDDAFELLHFIVRKRLQANRLTVVDATNVQEMARKKLISLAREFHTQVAAIAFMLPEDVCHERNASRPDRQFGNHVVRNQLRDLRRSLGHLRKEGVGEMHVLRSVEEVEAAEIVRRRLWTDRRDLTGPFDIIGDVHGCYDELVELMQKLGYRFEGKQIVPPDGRTAIFLGDLVDRGPNSPDVIRLVMRMVADGTGICVPGNHDVKLVRKLGGRDVQIAHGLAETLEQLEKEPPEFVEQARRFLDKLVSHFVLDGGKLVVAHAGLKEEMQGRASARVRDFCLYGETTGEIDEYGLPVRYPWANEYRGRAMVVYGHTPVPEPEWVNNTVDIDTGCVFGGRLTALRYPERDFVSVAARREYAVSKKPLIPAPTPLSAQHVVDDVLDLEDVSGKRLIDTRLRNKVTIREENATAALETMSRFAANPKWVVYLPPTMSPSETSNEEGYLEHPREAFAYFAREGIPTVICQEKHMGSRAVVVVCRTEEVARQRFGVIGEGIGTILTRTGRRFFEDSELEQALLARVVEGMESAGLWRELNTEWAVLDAELMPWSAKAQELIKRQYAPVGTSAKHSTQAALGALATVEHPDLVALREKIARRADAAVLYTESYRRYCWSVSSLDDFRLAPFHILATEGAAHVDKPHTWHMETLARFCDQGLLYATPSLQVNVDEPESVAAGIAWWEEMTGKGGEGMVVKPLDFIAHGPKGLVQPAVKCRGREYLRIIYGPEYTHPENLARLRKRGLSIKRGLALREFALGVEALERFVRREPLRKVHECVFGVLALESEPVDPRL